MLRARPSSRRRWCAFLENLTEEMEEAGQARVPACSHLLRPTLVAQACAPLLCALPVHAVRRLPVRDAAGAGAAGPYKRHRHLCAARIHARCVPPRRHPHRHIQRNVRLTSRLCCAGFFIDNRLYGKAAALAAPFDYNAYRTQKIKEKLDAERGSHITAKRKLPKARSPCVHARPVCASRGAGTHKLSAVAGQRGFGCTAAGIRRGCGGGRRAGSRRTGGGRRRGCSRGAARQAPERRGWHSLASAR
jgi:hypothetical protein